MLLSLLVSCSATHPIPLIQETTHLQRDTIYLNSQRYDSVYVARDSRWEYRRAQPASNDTLTPNALTPNPDTIVITKVERELRYRLLKDTVESVKLEVIRDSIPYPVKVEVIKEVRHTPWYARIFGMIGLITLCLVIKKMVIVAKHVVG